MQWTTFDDSMVPKVVRETRVTLSPRGDFYLNSGAVAALGDPVAVRVLFNKEEGKIGIAAAPLKSKGSYQLCTKYGRCAASRKFRALQFCRHLGILPENTIMFLNPKLENGILVLNIHTTVIAPRRGHPCGPLIREV
jgi:hypothetical protein